jgi:hypothetical protein
VAAALDEEGDVVSSSPRNLSAVSYVSDSKGKRRGTEATTSCSVTTLMRAPAPTGLSSLHRAEKTSNSESVASWMEAPELRTSRREKSFWERVGASMSALDRTQSNGTGAERTWSVILFAMKVIVGLGVCIMVCEMGIRRSIYTIQLTGNGTLSWGTRHTAL